MTHATGAVLRTLAGLCLSAVCAVPAFASADGPGQTQTIDRKRSEIGFSLKTRWGQQLEGRFDDWRGDIIVLPDGRHQVQLILDAESVEIIDSRAYTRITRGPGVFDAARFPEVRFLSDPFPATLARDGGEMTGILSIRGVQRRETFRIAASPCARPGLDCDVVGEGDVRRSQYAMDRWGYALADQVRFTLRMRALDVR